MFNIRQSLATAAARQSATTIDTLKGAIMFIKTKQNKTSLQTPYHILVKVYMYMKSDYRVLFKKLVPDIVYRCRNFWTIFNQQ